MKARDQQSFQTVPLKMVGSSVFGRYPKISVEQTFNMIVSDGWLVDYAGYDYAIRDQTGNVIPINPNGTGRGIYHSTISNRLYACIYNGIYLITPNLSFTLVGSLNTYTGDVFFAEDTDDHIAICDKTTIWIYTKTTGTFQQATLDGVNPLDFLPGYIAFQDDRFISVDLNSSSWRLSDPLNNNTQFPDDPQHVGGFQLKADVPVAAMPFPGLGSLLFVMGSIGTMLWQDVGATLFPYQQVTGINIDYGCLSADTIAALDVYVCWLGGNEKAGPVILVSTGGEPNAISTDGINFLLASLTAPSDSHAFMFREDGHIFYQITFVTDNLSLVYDFTTNLFFTLTDTYMNYHPAKKIAYFNNTYYFVSLNDGNLYQMSTKITTYTTNLIPRVRVLPTFRLPDNSPFVTQDITFTMEQGFDGSNQNSNQLEPNLLITEGQFNKTLSPITHQGLIIKTQDGRELITQNNLSNPEINTVLPFLPLPRVDLSISQDGGYVFSNYDGMQMNPLGYRKNRMIYYGLGWGNEITPQFRFWSQGRIVVGDGTMSIYQ